MKATTLSCSTMRLAMASAAAGSPPSSPKISLTGWPARPPRALTSALQALSAVMMGWTARPMTPLPVPNVPNTIGVLAAPGPGRPGVPGVGAAPAGRTAAPVAAVAPVAAGPPAPGRAAADGPTVGDLERAPAGVDGSMAPPPVAPAAAPAVPPVPPVAPGVVATSLDPDGRATGA